MTAGRHSRYAPGRDGSPSRPPPQTQPAEDGRLGEASLPNRKWLGHAVPSWVEHGIFFITINGERHGDDDLVSGTTADVIRDAALFYHGARWWIHLWLIMPDHVHALVSFPQAESMIKVVSDWKRFVSRKTGIGWQKGFFDHRLRKEESFDEKAHYIRMNPVRAGLVPSPKRCPHVWSFDRRDGSPIRPPTTTPQSPRCGRLGEASLPMRRTSTP